MRNRISRIIICFTLIMTLVLCEAAVGFASDEAAVSNNGVIEAASTVTKVKLKSYKFSKGNEYVYTGKEIKPKPVSAVVDVTYKTEGETTQYVTKTKTVKTFRKVTYKSNKYIGTGYAVVNIEGKTVNLPFKIKLGKIASIKSSPASYKSLKLSWSKVKGASGYKIYRSTSKSGSFKKIYTVKSGSTTSFTNNNLILGKTYYYKVRPYKIKGEYFIDGEISKYTAHRVQPLAPAIRSINRNTYNSLKVSWKSVAGADGYRIYRSTSAKGTYKGIATIRDERKLSYIDNGRTCGKRYYYKVRAYKVKGVKRIYSDASGYKSWRTSPSQTKFTENCQSWYSSVNLEWNKSNGASGYVIYRSKSALSGYVKVKTISSSKTTKWTNTGLNGSSKYYYKVRPYKSINGTVVYGAYSSAYAKYLVPKNLSTLVSRYEGKPYKYGGNTPKGWDCSGFVQWSIKYLFGKEIPRGGGDQARGGKYVNKDKMSSWRPGDVLVYKRNGGGVSHVGLYIGDGKIMHALNSRYDTIIQDVEYYEKWDRGNYLAGVRRY